MAAKSLMFMVYLRNEEDKSQREIAELNKILNKISIDLKIERCGEYDFLYIDYDDIETAKKLSRSAGKKSKLLDFTIGEIKEMRKEKSVCEVCREIGISRASYYRRMKEHEELGNTDDFHF